MAIGQPPMSPPHSLCDEGDVGSMQDLNDNNGNEDNQNKNSEDCNTNHGHSKEQNSQEEPECITISDDDDEDLNNDESGQVSDAAQDGIKREVEDEAVEDNDETFEDDFEDESGLGLSLNIDSVVGGVSEDHDQHEIPDNEGINQEQERLEDCQTNEAPPIVDDHNADYADNQDEDCPPDLDQPVQDATPDDANDAPVDLSSHDSVDVSGETVDAEPAQVKDEVEEREEESLPRIWYARKSTTPRLGSPTKRTTGN